MSFDKGFLLCHSGLNAIERLGILRKLLGVEILNIFKPQSFKDLGRNTRSAIRARCRSSVAIRVEHLHLLKQELVLGLSILPFASFLCDSGAETIQLLVHCRTPHGGWGRFFANKAWTLIARILRIGGTLNNYARSHIFHFAPFIECIVLLCYVQLQQKI
jgi:hypothetical protein